jgi:hypothetical protein
LVQDHGSTGVQNILSLPKIAAPKKARNVRNNKACDICIKNDLIHAIFTLQQYDTFPIWRSHFSVGINIFIKVLSYTATG